MNLIPFLALTNPCGLCVLTMLRLSRGSIVGLRHYATSRKVAGSNPDEVEFFNLSDPSSSTMALRSTQPLTEMSTGIFLGCKGRPVRKANNFTAICESIV
jgi:hypothetical protein